MPESEISKDTDDGPLQIISVRSRPVGIYRNHFGTALVAVERGYFPVSPTGYRSLAGFGRDQPGPLTIRPEDLESMAETQDRERKILLVNLRRALKPEREPRGNFIHVSLYVDKAIDDGFFAPATERAPLWQAAHRLLCLVDADPQFQPAPDRYAWNQEQCDRALANLRDLHGLLKRFAQGDYSGELPMPLFGARAYARLPVRPTGEPVVSLHETTIALSLNMTVPERSLAAPLRTSTRDINASNQPVQQSTQLGLFGMPDIPSIKAPGFSV